MLRNEDRLPVIPPPEPVQHQQELSRRQSPELPRLQLQLPIGPRFCPPHPVPERQPIVAGSGFAFPSGSSAGSSAVFSGVESMIAALSASLTALSVPPL